MSIAKLKPCPFCGGEAMKMTSTDGFTSIGCLECNPVFGVMVQAMTEAEAIKAWNTRAERTCKQEERGWGTEGDHARVWLTCGHDCIVPTVQDLPNYCPNCGAKVVDE